MSNLPSLIMLARGAVAAVLSRARVGRRRPCGMRRVVRMRVRHAVCGPRPRRATQPAAIPSRPLPIPVPVPLLIPISVPFAIPLPVSISVPVSVSIPLWPAPLSVHQIVRLHALFPILPILMFVFTSAGMEKRYGRELTSRLARYKLVEACKQMKLMNL